MYYLGQVETGPESGDGIPKPVPAPAPPSPIYVQPTAPPRPPSVTLIAAQPVVYAPPQVLKAQAQLKTIREAQAQVKGEYERRAEARDARQASQRREIETRARDLEDWQRFYAEQLAQAKARIAEARTPGELKAANAKLYEIQTAAEQSKDRQEKGLNRAKLALRDSLREEVAEEKEARRLDSALEVEISIATEALRKGNRAAVAALDNLTWGGQ